MSINKKQKLNEDRYIEYICFTRPKEYILVKPDIFKIEYLIIKNGESEKIENYLEGSELIILSQCIDAKKLKEQIIEVLNKKFKLAYGKEYFIGDKDLMLELIYQILLKEDDNEEKDLKIQVN